MSSIESIEDEAPKETLSEETEKLERRANVVRSRLLRTIDALDTRRHQVTEIGQQAKDAAPFVGLSLLGVAACTAGVVIGLRSYLKHRRQRLFVDRAKRFLSRFEVKEKPSTAKQVFQKVTTTVATMIAVEVARRTLTNVFDGRLPDGRLVVGRALDAHQRGMAR